MDEIIPKVDRTEALLGPSLWAVIYDNTHSESMLRKLCVDFCVWRGFKFSDIYTTHDDSFPREMLRDVAAASNYRHFEAKPKMKNPILDSKNYHVKSAVSRLRPQV